MSAPGQTRSICDVGPVSGCPKADMAGRFMSTRPCVTREELQTAIEKVGNSAASVRKELAAKS
ncbi:MAG: DUF3606 domain-containing protein [Xanthobacteraceae bacterium]